MAKKNDDFFKEKKPWSRVKDELLGCYFKPYVSKILHTYKPLIYVDCFAGKGKFEDGNDGSPLIALKTLAECAESTKMEDIHIETVFIDLNYAEDLRKNLIEYPNATIISGKYEKNIEQILRNKDNYNVFLYIDPYGIKALQHSLFESFAVRQFNSIELLVNLNSFGFIREACHALGAVFDDDELFDDLVEYDSTKMDASDKSIKELNEIAGGNYWQSIIDAYKKGDINGYEAEAMFAEAYCKRLSDGYKYVLNMPLRIKKGQRPKYRLIHATNHRDGCLLMVDNICNRWEAMQEIQSGGQLSFFEENYDNQVVDTAEIERKVIDHFSRCDNWTSLNDALAAFFVKHGPICSTGDIRNMIKQFESDRRIDVWRSPSKTKTGKPATFLIEVNDKKVLVRWKNEKGYKAYPTQDFDI